MNGQLAIPDYIDEAAKSIPNDTWAIVPNSNTSVQDGFRHLTYADLGAVVNSLSWWVEQNVGVAQYQGQTIGYMGTNDLRYLVVLAATLKAGYVPLFPSPRNSPEGQESLMKKTDCHVFLTTSEFIPQMGKFREFVPDLKVFQLPTIHELLFAFTSATQYQGRHSREPTASSLILHTSGSTGLPKPIRLTVAGLNTAHEQAQLEPEGGCQQLASVFLADRRPMLAAAPFFHAMGIIVGLRSIMNGGTIVRLPSEKMLSAGLVIEVIEATKPTFGTFPPSILEDLSATDKGVEALSKLEMVFFGGAPLASASGDKLCKATKLMTVIGSTEGLLFCSLVTSKPEEWGYFHWSFAAGVVMEPAEDGLSELVIKPKDSRYQGLFHTFPELEEYRTKDLFQQHPTKPYLWRYSGRRDDIIVLSNGEKFNPVSTEKLIESDPWVKGAVVVGAGKFQAGLLLEPAWDRVGTKDYSKLIDHVWPIVEQANREAPAHARIYPTKIAVTSPEKAFVRAAKGSIIRSQTTKLFSGEIEALYADEGYSSDPNPESKDEDDALANKVHTVFVRSLSSYKNDTSNDTDIFSLGVDSLDVLALANALNKALRGVNVTAPLIYSNPSVDQLCAILSQNGKSSSGRQADPPTREEKLAAMVSKYTKNMVRPQSATEQPKPPSKHTVVVTGSTGSLGSHVLEQLLRNPDVEKVYCMNRSDNAETRQKDAFQQYHDASVDFSKAVFLKTDFALDHFGLSDEIYSELLSTVTVFIHSAWSVDFNLSLESYEATHIAGTRRAIDFASASINKPSITFISSIASVGNWSRIVQDGSAMPESVTSIFDNSLALPQGYGKSKHVASQILATASHRLGIRTAIIRAGQLAGPSTEHGKGAAWNRHEWLPTLIHTSKVLKKLPRTLGNQDHIDWLPMDKAAGGVIDISLSPASSSELTQVYHLVNPRTTTWEHLYPVVEGFYRESNNDIEVVEYEEWLQELKKLPRTKENAESVPGLKLLEFYESLAPGNVTGMPALSTKRAEEASPILSACRPVDEEVMRKWLVQWGF